jgi:hypothetical protein
MQPARCGLSASRLRFRTSQDGTHGKPARLSPRLKFEPTYKIQRSYSQERKPMHERQAPNYAANSARGNSVQRCLSKAASAAVVSLPLKRNRHAQRVQVYIVIF